jgi:hypothetical protein
VFTAKRVSLMLNELLILPKAGRIRRMGLS